MADKREEDNVSSKKRATLFFFEGNKMVPDPEMIYRKKRIRHQLRTIYFSDDSDDDLAANGILDIGLTVQEQLMQMAQMGYQTEFVPIHLFPILQQGALNDESLSSIEDNEDTETDEEFISDSLADSCEGNICYPSEESFNEMTDEEGLFEDGYISPAEEQTFSEIDEEYPITGNNNDDSEEEIIVKNEANFQINNCDLNNNLLFIPQAGEQRVEEED